MFSSVASDSFPPTKLRELRSSKLSVLTVPFFPWPFRYIFSLEVDSSLVTAPTPHGCWEMEKGTKKAIWVFLLAKCSGSFSTIPGNTREDFPLATDLQCPGCLWKTVLADEVSVCSISSALHLFPGGYNIHLSLNPLTASPRKQAALE